MKIVYDDQIFIEQNWGGISNLFSNYFKQINESKKYRISLPFLFVFSKILSKKKIRFNRNEYNYHLIKFFNFLTVNFYLLFFKYDILHLTYFRKNLINKKNKKFVISIPDMIPESNRHLFKNYKLVHPYKKELAKKADLIITISKVSKKKIIESYKLNNKKVIVIYPSIDSNIKIKKKYPKIYNYILFVGNRDDYKNFKILFDVFTNLLKKFKDLKLVCIGKEFSSQENKIINMRNLNEKIINVGFVSDEYKNFLYQKAKLFIFPSLDEGFGIPIIESYANRCPIILANTEIFKEVAGKFGIFYKKNSKRDLYKKLHQVLSKNVIYRKRFRTKKFKVFFQRYSHNNSKINLENAYSKLINS